MVFLDTKKKRTAASHHPLSSSPLFRYDPPHKTIPPQTRSLRFRTNSNHIAVYSRLLKNPDPSMRQRIQGKTGSWCYQAKYKCWLRGASSISRAEKKKNTSGFFFGPYVLAEAMIILGGKNAVIMFTPQKNAFRAPFFALMPPFFV